MQLPEELSEGASFCRYGTRGKRTHQHRCRRDRSGRSGGPILLSGSAMYGRPPTLSAAGLGVSLSRSRGLWRCPRGGWLSWLGVEEAPWFAVAGLGAIPDVVVADMFAIRVSSLARRRSAGCSLLPRGRTGGCGHLTIGAPGFHNAIRRLGKFVKVCDLPAGEYAPNFCW